MYTNNSLIMHLSAQKIDQGEITFGGITFKLFKNRFEKYIKETDKKRKFEVKLFYIIILQRNLLTSSFIYKKSSLRCSQLDPPG